MTTIPILTVVSLVAIALLVGILLGAFLGITLYERATERGFRLSRSGIARPVAPHPSRVPEIPADMQAAVAGADAVRTGHATLTDTDATWAASVARAVERGADEFQAGSPGMSRGKARKMARQAIESVGAHKPQGGIPNA